MKRLPIGIQSFRELRTGGYLYVDKTQDIHRLVTMGKYYFLSRPRRFGKSLVVTTLKELYSGSKELFEGLWIADNWDWEKTNPIIHFPFSSMGYLTLGLENALHNTLDETAQRYGVELVSETYDGKFKELMRKLAPIGKVVVLVDEYDKPIIDYIGKDLPQALANQNIFKTFYSVLKDSDDYLELVFITGVSKFSKVSIFSDLNNLHDITLHPKFSTIVGYTQTELEANFEEHLLEMMEVQGLDRTELLEKIKLWYNGYTWDTKRKVYNPFSILLMFSAMEFQEYWFKSATPTFLIDLLRDKELYNFEKVRVGPTVFDNFEISKNLDVISLLWQTGYLTIAEVDEFRIYTLDYPNKEVRDAFLEYMLNGFSHAAVTAARPMVADIRHAFMRNDLGSVKSNLDTLLKNLPYQLFEKTEKFYHAILHLTFFYLGVFIESEVCTSDGRADAVVQTPNHIYCFEFKIDESGDVALSQIAQKGYLEKYRRSGKTLVGVGVNFSTEKRKIDDWKVKNIASALPEI